MKTQKSILKENIEKSLIESKLNLTEHQAYTIAVMVSNMAMDEIINTSAEQVKMRDELIKEYENNRFEFRNFVESLQKAVKPIMPELMNQGMVSFEINPKTKKKQIKARSTVLQGVVRLLNQLDDLCMDFYGKVYKYEDDGKVQLSIFPNDVLMREENKKQ